MLTDLAMVLMFLLLFMCYLSALRQVSLFGEASRFLVAACVAGLSVLGLLRMAPPGSDGAAAVIDGQNKGFVLEILLLPHAALAVALVCILAAWLIRDSWSEGRREKGARSAQDEPSASSGQAVDGEHEAVRPTEHRDNPIVRDEKDTR